MGFAVSIRVHNITDYIQNYLKKRITVMQTKANTGNRITYIKKEQKSVKGGNRGKSIENTRNKVAEDAYDSQMT